MRQILSIIPLLVLPFHAIASEDDLQRLKTSAQVLDEIMGSGDKSIPSGLFAKAQCVIVIPNMKKAGFVFSGKYGRGFATCRNAGGGWTGPAAMRIEGGGFGLQAGASEVDIVMLVMNQRGMQSLLASKVTLGGEASVAAGPVGRDATAQTDATMHADILSWSRSRGVFGGISLQGGTLRPDEEEVNKAIYGQKESNADILAGKAKVPGGADALIASISKYGGETQSK